MLCRVCSNPRGDEQCRVMYKKKGIEVGRLDNSYYDRERRVRRWFGEVIITCYQMTVLAEAGGSADASALCLRIVADVFSCGVRELFCVVNCGED